MWMTIKLLASGVLSFLKPLLLILLQDAGKVIIAAALEAVTMARDTASADATGADKFDIAKTAFLAAISAQGITLAGNLVNAILEAAYAKLKATAGEI